MKWFLVAGGAAVAAVAAVAFFFIAVESRDVTPRRLAQYAEHRASGHGPAIVSIGRAIARTLLALDRGEPGVRYPPPIPGLEGDAESARLAILRRDIVVSTSKEALDAIASAEPGDAITFLPGRYAFDGDSIDVNRPGTVNAPIIVRADRQGTVVLDLHMVEGFLVSAPYWTFENLVIRGVCADDSSCEHAFHVVAGASHFIARTNTITDFNAHFKINASGGRVPDFGLIEGNTLANRTVRDTENPVSLIDLVAASHWRIRANRISDFAKGRSDQISYGAFAKGGGEDNRFEQNVVICEDMLRSASGQRVGISLGGGGTAAAACRDGRCITEQDRSVVESNFIASCSDDGIYLNRAAISRIAHNTLIDTGGITARSGESSAEVEGNLVDGAVRSISGATLHARDNVLTSLTELYLGWHPVRRMFVDALAFDLRWRSAPPRQPITSSSPPDLCGGKRPSQPAYGAFESVDRCPRGS